MKIQKNDPRLMQYVLNEISPADRLLVESAMQTDSEIANEISELKELIQPLNQHFSEPAQMSLSKERKQALFAQTIHAKSIKKSWWQAAYRSPWITGGIFATAFTAFVFNHVLDSSRKNMNASMERSDAMYAPSNAMRVQAKKVPAVPAEPRAAKLPVTPPPVEEVASEKIALGDSSRAAKMASQLSGSARALMKSDNDNASLSADMAQTRPAKSLTKLTLEESMQNSSELDTETKKLIEKVVNYCVYYFDVESGLHFTFDSVRSEIEVQSVSDPKMTLCLKKTFVQMQWPKPGKYEFKFKPVSE